MLINFMQEGHVYIMYYVCIVSSSIARSNSFTSHDQLSVAAKGRSRFRLSVNMGSYCNTEESNVSNCSLFIDDLVSLLTCVNERVGVKVCVCVYVCVCVCACVHAHMCVYV